MNHSDQKNELYSILILAGATLSLHRRELDFVVYASFVAFVILLMGQSKRAKGIGFLGNAANLVTLGRLALLLMASLFYEVIGPIWYGVVAVMVVIGDALDGFVARKFDLASEFGARLDMETDAIYVAVLSINAYLLFDAGWLVLLAGLMRYLFVWILRWTGLGLTEAPRIKGARIVAVIFFLVLITPYFISSVLSVYMMQLGAVLILGSFVFEFVLRNQRKEKGPTIE